MRHDYLLRKRDAVLASGGLFWLPSGMSYDNVLAAYQFKGVASEADSLADISGHGRTLTKHSQSGNTPTWNSSYGWKFDAVYQGLCGYLNNAALNNQAIVCAVVRYSNLSNQDRGWLITAGGSTGLAQLMAKSAVWESSQVKTYDGPGYPSSSGHWQTSSAGTPTAGVIGANFGSADKVYVDGVRRNTTTRSANTDKGDESWHTFGP